MEEYVPETIMNDPYCSHPNVLLLSAKSNESLSGIIESYIPFLNKEQPLLMRDLCYTANTGRGHYSQRIAIIFENKADLQNKIGRLAGSRLGEQNYDYMWYGSHKVVSSNKKELMANEIKEAKRMELSRTAAQQLTAFIQSGKTDISVLQQLCELYVNGADINCEDLYRGEGRNKIAAPLYVFEQNSCWLDMPSAVANKSNEDGLFYGMEWRKSNETFSLSNRNNKEGTAVIFKDRSETGSMVINSLRMHHEHVIEVDLVNEMIYNKLSSYSYQIDGSKDSYMRLMGDLKEIVISQIVHLFTRISTSNEDTVQSLRERQKVGAYSLFYLAKSIANAGIHNEIDFLILSQYAKEVSGDEPRIIPDNASVYGMGKVIMKEQPYLKCRFIDCDEVTPFTTLINELHSTSNDYATAYRNNERFTEMFTEISIEKQRPTICL